MDLVFGEWWTEFQATSDAQGLVSLDGFLGEYAVTATVGGADYFGEFSLSDTGGSWLIVVPEPSAWAVLVAGLPLVLGSEAGRRRRAAAAARLSNPARLNVAVADTF